MTDRLDSKNIYAINPAYDKKIKGELKARFLYWVYLVNNNEICYTYDTNGGNALVLLGLLHNKAPHRKAVMEKVYEYLFE